MKVQEFMAAVFSILAIATIPAVLGYYAGTQMQKIQEETATELTCCQQVAARVDSLEVKVGVQEAEIKSMKDWRYGLYKKYGWR